jgi:hypothetical protein
VRCIRLGANKSTVPVACGLRPCAQRLSWIRRGSFTRIRVHAHWLRAQRVRVTLHIWTRAPGATLLGLLTASVTSSCEIPSMSPRRTIGGFERFLSPCLVKQSSYFALDDPVLDLHAPMASNGLGKLYTLRFGHNRTR